MIVQLPVTVSGRNKNKKREKQNDFSRHPVADSYVTSNKIVRKKKQKQKLYQLKSSLAFIEEKLYDLKDLIERK